MTLQIIPTTDSAFRRIVVTLDGVPYLFSFAYNQRCDCWYIDLATAEGDPIACGIKLVCFWNLLRTVVDGRRPPGKLAVISVTTDDTPPGLEDLVPGGRCLLAYQPSAQPSVTGGASGFATGSGGSGGSGGGGGGGGSGGGTIPGPPGPTGPPGPVGPAGPTGKPPAIYMPVGPGAGTYTSATIIPAGSTISNVRFVSAGGAGTAIQIGILGSLGLFIPSGLWDPNVATSYEADMLTPMGGTAGDVVVTITGGGSGAGHVWIDYETPTT